MESNKFRVFFVFATTMAVQKRLAVLNVPRVCASLLLFLKAALSTGLKIDSCSPNDAIFTKAREGIEAFIFKNGVLSKQPQNVSVSSEMRCMEKCKSIQCGYICNSAQYNKDTKLCLQQSLDRFKLTVRIRVLTAGNSYFEKRECSQDFSRETRFIANVPTALDCQDVYRRGWRVDGVYAVKARDLDGGWLIPVLCKMSIDGGVVQQRISGTFEMRKPWRSYKSGFGSLLDDFWQGNDFLHNSTTGHSNQVMFVLTDENGAVSYPLYNDFGVGSEDYNYRFVVLRPIVCFSPVTFIQRCSNVVWTLTTLKQRRVLAGYS